jgi:acyl-CoA reductase-like NAD-dependent aldehyde dehydrogenase
MVFAPTSAGVAARERPGRAELDAAVAALRVRRDVWAALPIRRRIALLDELRRDFLAVAPRIVEASVAAKGPSAGARLVGEEWVNVYCVVRNLRLLREALSEIADHGRPRVPGPVEVGPGGQVVVGVFPRTLTDRLLFPGLTAEVWMEPGVTPDELAATQAGAYRDVHTDGAVALVLGPGNNAATGPMDLLYKLFVENRVVLYKCHPVNDCLAPLLAEGLRALVEPGFLRIVSGGAAEGEYLCRHPDVADIHVTGARETYEAIVADESAATKRITAELGCVSPLIVVPGPWSDDDVEYQADQLATALTDNGGFNCATPRAIVQHAGWSGRRRLLDALGRALDRVPPRQPFYPGADERYRRFLAVHPEAELHGSDAERRLPWALIPGLSERWRDDPCFTSETFCGVVAEVAIEADGAAEYVDRAVAFANERLWGTLDATVIAGPASLRDRQIGPAVERAIADLRYGTVALNVWAGYGFALGVTGWGGFPEPAAAGTQSGVGTVHNTPMFARPQKSVLRAPFRRRPRPASFVGHRRFDEVSRHMAHLEAAPSSRALFAVAWAAARG